MTTILHTSIFGEPPLPPLVMLHGFMGKGSSLEPLIPELSRKFHVITLDLPGHGRSLFSTMPREHRPADFFQAAALILADLDHLGIDRFTLYGYSMGGRLAQAVCLQAPERVDHLFLESAAFGIKDPEERQQRYEQDLLLLDGVDNVGDFKGFLAAWHAMPLFSALAGTTLLFEMMQAKLQNQVDELRRALAVLSVGAHPCFEENLARLDIPITYFFGEQDAKYSAIATNVAATLPRMKLISIPRASHNIHVQYPEIITDAVMTAGG